MKEVYHCYLNGSFYGAGSKEYMKELFIDYVVTCEMYGKDKCSFEIVKKDLNKVRKKIIFETINDNKDALSQSED
ncbi:hypothetical protein NSS71_08410 [Niallia sp. FSL W8-0951]|uniref:hypothetical protein n=1 Tax=Niallia sp. FSL W8-0951 TaxID=2954639 RepID=UPI0030F882F0